MCHLPHADFVLDWLTPEQCDDIRVYHQSVPLPERRADLRAGMSGLITAWAGGFKDVQLDDLLPDYDKPPASDEPEQDQDEMDRQMSKVVGLMGAKERAGHGR